MQVAFCLLWLDHSWSWKEVLSIASTVVVVIQISCMLKSLLVMGFTFVIGVISPSWNAFRYYLIPLSISLTHFLCISFSSENVIRAPRLLAPKQQCRPSICIGEIGNQVDTAHGHDSHMCRLSMLKHNFTLDETELELHKARPRGQIREGADVCSCAAMIMNEGQMQISQSKGERKWCCCAKW